jgi:cytidylate kinase
VAAQLGYRHLDSGAFYRAITLAALSRDIPVEKWPDLTAEDLKGFAVSAAPTGEGYELRINRAPVGDRIRTPEVNAHVSRMAALPADRDWLLDTLRHTGETGGLVADGRDMGSVVFPDADLKVFLVCEPAERARRRLREQGITNPSESEVRQEEVRLVARDHQDETREAYPLIQAPDAIPLETTDLDFASQVNAVVDLARREHPPGGSA